MQKNVFLNRMVGSAVCLVLSGVVSAQALPAGAVASVNGVPISETVFEKVVQNNVARGAKDTPEMRTELKKELIARELFSQQAEKLGLHKTPEAKLQLAELRQTFLVELLLSDHFSKNPIGDAELKSEYDRQVGAIKGMASFQQYQLRQILLANDTDARAAMAALQAGEAFDAVAKQRSIDPTKEQGGLVGWVLPNQILPPLANVLVNMVKGAVSAVPIQTQAGWHILKLEDTKPFVPPTFDESKERIKQGLVQAKKLELLASLRKAAKVVQ